MRRGGVQGVQGVRGFSKAESGARIRVLLLVLLILLILLVLLELLERLRLSHQYHRAVLEADFMDGAGTTELVGASEDHVDRGFSLGLEPL